MSAPSSNRDPSPGAPDPSSAAPSASADASKADLSRDDASKSDASKADAPKIDPSKPARDPSSGAAPSSDVDPSQTARDPSSAFDPSSKILSRDELVRRLGRPRERTVVFTNGVFDVLHRGHVEYLAMARALGDLLVVGLNADDSVRRLKGPTRPVNGEEDRAYVLAGLASVDYVTLFGEDTPRDLIAALLPDVLVKGGDYRRETIVGGDEVEAAGGRVVVAPLVPGRSTTSILERARQGAGNGSG